MAARRKSIALTLLLGLVACDGKGLSGEDSSSFFDVLLTGYHIDYVAVSGVPEMTKLSELVIVGEMRDVQQGGIALGNPTVVAQLRIDRVLKGQDQGGAIYVELMGGPLATTRTLSRVLPVGAGIWFLQDALASVSSPLDQARGQGLPSGERLYAAASPQGLLMEADGELVQPLEPDHHLWLPDIEQYASLWQAAAAVEGTVNDASF